MSVATGTAKRANGHKLPLIPPSSTSDGGTANPFDDTHGNPVWKAVFEENERMIAHIAGTAMRDGTMVDHDEFGLDKVVATFYATTLRVPSGMNADQLTAMISRYPEGAYANRAGTKQLRDDVRHLWQQSVEAMKLAAEYRHRLAAALFDPWADLDPPQWPTGVLAPEFEATIIALAKRDGCDLGALGMSYVTAVSGAAHKDMRFAPFQHGEWQVPPIVYVMAVSDPGFRKSVLISTAFAALWRHDKAEWDAYRVAAQGDPKLEEPAPRIVSDVSVEKLQTIILSAPRGAMYLRDEIAPMFDFKRYSRGSGAAERAFFLTAYEGGETRVHRISRATDHGNPSGVTVFGGIQVDRIADFGDLGNDGLMQRFVPIVIARHNLTEPDVQVHGKHKLDAAVGTVARDRWHSLYCTTPDGSALIRRTEEIGHKMAAVTDYGKIMQGFCYKLHGLHARLAFLLHLLDAPHVSIIPAATIERAARLTMFCLGHFQAFTSRTPDKPLEATKSVAGYILARTAPQGDDPERIVASTITNGVRLCRGMSLRRLAEVLDPLIAGGWLTAETPYPDNNAWIVTRGLRDALARRAAAERERRLAAREAILAAAAGRREERA